MKTTIDRIVVEQFHEHAIAFHPGDAFVNLTTMCKAFNKRPLHFLQLDSTKQFASVLQAQTDGNPVSLTLEGRNGGTWAHPDLALECARWLSPEFAIWTNRVIRGLLSGQPVLSSPEEREIVSVMDSLRAVIQGVVDGTIKIGAAQAINVAACQYLRAWDVRLRLRGPGPVPVLT